jgi:hypothetical protein
MLIITSFYSFMHFLDMIKSTHCVNKLEEMFFLNENPLCNSCYFVFCFPVSIFQFFYFFLFPFSPRFPVLLLRSLCPQSELTMQSYMVLYMYMTYLIWRCEQMFLIATLQGKIHICIPFLGIARPQSQFPHSRVCERYLYSQDWSTYFPASE